MSNTNTNQRIIITGGPGSGKTSLLDALIAKGYAGMPEVSRRLIREQVSLQSDALPWQNLPAFANLCLEAMLDDYRKATTCAFYDRAIPDILGYLRAAGITPEQDLNSAARAFPYCPMVFIAPPWKNIYRQDEERWQTFEESAILYRHIQGVYVSLGYRLIELPFASVADRISFVEEKIKRWKAKLEENLCGV
ncbi:AAA family ATPase [Dyadobacter tibetensis]|uniref:AAA family ATPase n=1 Tax=Dyadobacter tibetensis TaxID=1211851 RepID=UPI000470CF72|nr:AAA family ATPase [Dyadobacter tibetensis]